MFEETDRVPLFELFVSSKVLEQVLGISLVEKGQAGRTAAPLSETVKAHTGVGLDCFVVDTLIKSENNKIVDEKSYVDEWGRLFSRTLRGQDSDFYIGGHLGSLEQYDDFPRPDPFDTWRVERYMEAVKAAGDRILIIPGVGSIYEVTAEAIGYENFFRCIYLKPDFIERALRDAAYFTIEQGKVCVDAGAEVLMVYDDYAYKHGPEISPKLWMKFVFPLLKQTADSFHKRGAFMLLHTDGNIRPLMDGIINSGVDGIQPIDPSAGMTLTEAKEAWGDKLCLIGNIDVGRHSFGTPTEIAAEVKRAIETAAPGGGYLLGSGHYINEACKPENFIAQVETCRKYGVYAKIRS